MFAALVLWSCSDDGATTADAATDGDAATGDAGLDAGDGGEVDPLLHLSPGDATGLSPGNMDGQDEDPALLVRQDGSLVAAWYSNRNGDDDKEIFVVGSHDGTSWTDPPAQATRADPWAFAPTLAEDGAGVVHLAWWQVTNLPEGCDPDTSCTGTDNRVFAARSPDGVDWDTGAAEEVTAGPGDWLPALLWDAGRGALAIYFSAVERNGDGEVDLAEGRARLYRVVRDDDGWSPPERLLGLDTESTHEQYPQVARAADGTTWITWTRYDAVESPDPSHVVDVPSTDTMLASSADGLTWSAPRRLGESAAVDVFPILYADRVSWRTEATSVELPVGGAYPDDLVERPELTGYTARVVVTHTPGIVWAAWVAGSRPNQKIEHAFLAWSLP